MRNVLPAVGLAAGLLLSGCGGAPGEPPSPAAADGPQGTAEAAVTVDERAGEIGGVRLGDTAADVRAKLGAPTGTGGGVFPAGARFTGPPSVPLPPSDQSKTSPPEPPEVLHYESLAVLVSPTVGVFAMATLDEAATTRAGVAIGDPLERVRERYRETRCGEAVAGEAPFGDPPTYRWCRVRLGRMELFFGGDPIESITLRTLARR